MRRLLAASISILLACGKHSAESTAGGEACTASAVLDEIRVDSPCVDGGDPEEDVDEQDPGKKHTPRPVLEPDVYTVTIRANESDIGGARIRSRLVFEVNDLRNVLGLLPSCTTVRAAGPMKNDTFSAGVGYSIRLVDPQNRRCQGFVSASVVTVVASTPR